MFCLIRSILRVRSENSVSKRRVMLWGLDAFTGGHSFRQVLLIRFPA